MESDINKLFDSLPKYPNYMVMHFCDNSNLINKIECFAKDAREYFIFSFDKDIVDNLKDYKKDKTIIKYINPKRPRYHSPTKSYDYLFITSLPEDRNEFFKKIYNALKNGASLFIFLDSAKKTLSYTIESELIENNYVAINIFDVDNILVISAKKMHGWGS